MGHILCVFHLMIISNLVTNTQFDSNSMNVLKVSLCQRTKTWKESECRWTRLVTEGTVVTPPTFCRRSWVVVGLCLHFIVLSRSSVDPTSMMIIWLQLVRRLVKDVSRKLNPPFFASSVENLFCDRLRFYIITKKSSSTSVPFHDSDLKL